jgi:hypothetical protein
MKNITKVLFAGALALPMIGSAQVNVGTTPENRNAVIEEWTGINCVYCPTGHAAVQTAIDNNVGDVVGINIHSGGYAAPSGGQPDFRTPEGTVLDGAFPISGYPASTLNRRTIGGEQVYHPANSNQPDKVPTVIAEISEVNMHITATVDINTRQLDVDVEYYYTSDAPSATNYMYVAILQNNVAGPQTGGATYNPSAILPNGDYNHMHMFRGFMTAQWGDAITTTTTGSTAIMSYSEVLPLDINGVALDISNLEIAAYINDGFEDAGDVLTGYSIYPTLTGFASNDEVIYESSLMNDVFECEAGPVTENPTATIRNWGSSQLTTATITYDVNGGTPVVMNWSGSIAPGSSEEITLNPITFTPNAGPNTLNVTISDPNGTADITTDNSGSSNFTANMTAAEAFDYTVTVNLTTDRYASETTWEITDGAGTVIASAGPWSNLSANGTTVQTPVDVNIVANECYTFTIYDSYGDGIDSGFGQGSFSVEDQQGNVLTSGGNFTTEDFGLFKTAADANINEVTFEEVSIFPNPASEVLNVTFDTDAAEYSVAILDLQGRAIASQSGSNNVSFPVADLASGSYIVKISSENGVYTENVVIK